MTKGNVVCFDCRIALRRATWRLVTFMKPETIGSTGKTLCPHCRQPCQFLGPSIPVPKKRDAKGWENLRQAILKKRLDVYSQSIKKAVRAKHDLEQQIQELEGKDANAGRKSLIKRLKSQRANL